VIKDILYGDAANGEDNLLDLYLPSGTTGPIPVIIWIHGGGLTTGDKSMGAQGLPLAANGFAIASINYRLTPDYYLPTQLHDAKAAVRWVRANASQYNFDTNNIGVIGGSAGAMLTASVGTSGDVAEVEGDVGDNLGYSTRVHAVVPMAGIYDLFNFFQGQVNSCTVGDMGSENRCYLEYFVGCSLVYQSCWDAVRQGSAISYVSADDPPFLTLIGSEDETPHGLEDHQNFHQALLDAGVDSTLTIVPGAVHGECYKREFDRILAFFTLHLKD
jgi:acetyl esterase/lipase